jgi:hypothetical protein
LLQLTDRKFGKVPHFFRLSINGQFRIGTAL